MTEINNGSKVIRLPIERNIKPTRFERILRDHPVLAAGGLLSGILGVAAGAPVVDQWMANRDRPAPIVSEYTLPTTYSWGPIEGSEAQAKDYAFAEIPNPKNPDGTKLTEAQLKTGFVNADISTSQLRGYFVRGATSVVRTEDDGRLEFTPDHEAENQWFVLADPITIKNADGTQQDVSVYFPAGFIKQNDLQTFGTQPPPPGK